MSRKRKRIDLTPKRSVSPGTYEARLDVLVKDYLATRGVPCILTLISTFTTITDFVCGAVNDPKVHGYRKFNVDKRHQRYYNTKDAKPFIEKFIYDLEVANPIREFDFNNFEELFSEVAIRAKKVKYVGAVGVYDFSIRFGWNRNVFAGKPQIVPQEFVYIHSNPLLSSILLAELDPTFPKFIKNDNVNWSFRLPYDKMHEVYKKNTMDAFMIEDFLCHSFDYILDMYNDLSGNHIKKDDIKMDEKYLK